MAHLIKLTIVYAARFQRPAMCQEAKLNRWKWKETCQMDWDIQVNDVHTAAWCSLPVKPACTKWLKSSPPIWTRGSMEILWSDRKPVRDLYLAFAAVLTSANSSEVEHMLYFCNASMPELVRQASYRWVLDFSSKLLHHLAETEEILITPKRNWCELLKHALLSCPLTLEKAVSANYLGCRLGMEKKCPIACWARNSLQKTGSGTGFSVLSSKSRQISLNMFFHYH